MSKNRIWMIPLAFKPQLVQMGQAIRGRHMVERECLQGLWSLNLYQHEGVVRAEGQSYSVRAGFVGLFGPGVEVEYRFNKVEAKTESYAHFILPDIRSDTLPVPAVQDMGTRYGVLQQRLEEAIRYFPTQARRAEVRLWDLLWELTGLTDAPAAMHPAIEKVKQAIEVRLADPIRVAQLAREADLSHNHLTRLFHAATGKTVAGYIRHRRIERARHLLKNSTLPVSAIAADVGMPDLQMFNKVIRKELGAAPRKLRK